MTQTIYDFTYNFDVHYLMTMQEQKHKSNKSGRLNLLIKFIKANRSKYDLQTWKAVKTMLDYQHRACWVFDQWFHVCHGASPFCGANDFDKKVSEQLKDVVADMRGAV